MIPFVSALFFFVVATIIVSYSKLPDTRKINWLTISFVIAMVIFSALKAVSYESN